jgi:gamma-glutamylcyclotransferase (GGCT)/AIG2-like uncharacterized protein YtfP
MKITETMQKEKTYYVFVYGTLKVGGGNHYLLSNSRFIERYVLDDHILYDIGHGFPYMTRGGGYGATYGEIYEIDKDTLNRLDALEGLGSLYNRDSIKYLDKTRIKKVNDSPFICVDLYFYTAIINDFGKYEKLPNGYWSNGNHKEIFNVVVDGREYSDTADKIVFHMRFFDGERTPTNIDYMKLVKARCHIEHLDTNSELIFVTQLISHGVIKETF